MSRTRNLHFVILDSTANLVDSFDTESEAREALQRIVQQHPDAADDYAMLTYDEHGQPVGPAASAERDIMVEAPIEFHGVPAPDGLSRIVESECAAKHRALADNARLRKIIAELYAARGLQLTPLGNRIRQAFREANES